MRRRRVGGIANIQPGLQPLTDSCCLDLYVAALLTSCIEKDMKCSNATPILAPTFTPGLNKFELSLKGVSHFWTEQGSSSLLGSCWSKCECSSGSRGGEKIISYADTSQGTIIGMTLNLGNRRFVFLTPFGTKRELGLSPLYFVAISSPFLCLSYTDENLPSGLWGCGGCGDKGYEFVDVDDFISLIW